jgi:hypothetical protein
MPRVRSAVRNVAHHRNGTLGALSHVAYSSLLRSSSTSLGLKTMLPYWIRAFARLSWGIRFRRLSNIPKGAARWRLREPDWISVPGRSNEAGVSPAMGIA